jgi:hypothetical protein
MSGEHKTIKLGFPREDWLVTGDDEQSKPPLLKVVSENPNAHTDRQITWAKQEAQNALSRFAASLLRTMAGSDSEAAYLIRRLAEFIDALKELNALSGRGLTTQELESALHLPDAGLDGSASDYSYRLWLREHGMEVIVQGALRLAAHKVLGERPHFGGKYSEEVIRRGIKLLEELNRPPPKLPSLPGKKGKAAKWDDLDLGGSEAKSPSKASRPMAMTSSVGSATTGLRPRQRRGFGQEDLRELRKAIKAKDSKRIAELTAKLGQRPSDD